MPDPLLTIIMPCFNAEDTVETALQSIFEQNLSVPFEVVIVDDGSTDHSREIVKKYAIDDSRIRLITHEKNLGGGAARNTAVEHAHGSLIFCLDSDDILPQNMLPRLLDRFNKQHCDGVLFEETHFFGGDTPDESIKNKKINAPVEIRDMFEKGAGFYARVNFLYTKESWKLIGGYPTHHGFDTQTFGYRFLRAGLKVFVAPGTYYLHRRNEKISYFDRESRSGKLSLNTYLMYEDIFHLFSEQVKQQIITFDIFRRHSLGKDNLEMMLSSLYTGHPDLFFRSDYESFLMPQSAEAYQGNTSSSPSEHFAQAVILYKQKRFDEAHVIYESLAKDFPHSTILQMNIERCLLKKKGLTEKEITENVYNTFSHVNFLTKLINGFRS